MTFWPQHAAHIEQRSDWGRQLQVLLQARLGDRAALQQAERGGGFVLRVNERGRTHDTDKAVTRPAALREGGRRWREEDRELYVFRQPAGDTRGPRSDFGGVLQRVIIGA